MTWFRCDDAIVDHPKFVGVRQARYGRAAIGDWFIAGCWSSRHLTNGFVPKPILKAFDIRPTSVRLLTENGLWDEAEGGYQFHDWLDYNPSKQEVLAKRAADARRQAKGRETQKSRRDSSGPGPARPGPARPQVPPGSTPDVPLGNITTGLSFRSLDKMAIREHAAAWFFEQGRAMPTLTGKAFDEFAKRVDDTAKAFKIGIGDATRRIVQAAEELYAKTPFVFRVRVCDPAMTDAETLAHKYPDGVPEWAK